MPPLKDSTILVTPSAQGEVFHFCIGNHGADVQLLWLGWLTFLPARDLSTAMVPPAPSSPKPAPHTHSSWLVRAAIALRCQR